MAATAEPRLFFGDDRESPKLTLFEIAIVLPARAEQLMSRSTAYAFSFKKLDGGDIVLSAFAGKSILVVNVASLCGYTPQYTGLQQLWTRYRQHGLAVIGVPSNDFFQE